ncbi:response regulator [Anoxynatronum buryatiense]|uniref:Stage 0 sporulation protein A homolog n=1 Tax=Anoxynatronum buryatiense TaxID=489973 RepID=A0AA45WWN0_9CLOT|nr:response regulator [Anoxynatronum buryatiense]SMP58610.1 Response regulator receiver domain-containing protein [Anoxynatronum buryatiense]
MDQRDAVLFVDDEINVLSSLKRGMMDEPYTCYFASSGKEALVILEEKTISVIVTDMRMPEMTGLKLLQEVTKVSPDTVKIVLSGYTQIQQILATINTVDIFKFITKPWKMEEEFKVIIQQAVAYYRMKKEHEQLKHDLENRNKVYRNMLATMTGRVATAQKQVQLVGALAEKMLEYAHRHQHTESAGIRAMLEQQPVFFQTLEKIILMQADQQTADELEAWLRTELSRSFSLEKVTTGRLPAEKKTGEVEKRPVPGSTDGRLMAGGMKMILDMLPPTLRDQPILLETTQPSHHIFHCLLRIPLGEGEAAQIDPDCIQYLNMVLGKALETVEIHFSAVNEAHHLVMKMTTPLKEPS